MPRFPKLMLASIGNGGLEEIFQRVLGDVVENIADGNTDPTKPREITIKLKIVPESKRKQANVQYSVAAKLVSIQTQSTNIYLAKGPGGEIEVSEINPAQPELFSVIKKEESANG